MPKKPNTSIKKRLAIGVSGSGTTYAAIARAIKKGELNLELAFVFADRNCMALEKAKLLGTNIVQRKEGEELNTFHERILKLLSEKKVDIVALAGYLRLFPVSGDDPYLVINSHPAAIPYFGGEGMWGHFVHEAVLAWAQKTGYSFPYTFSTIHVASTEYDRGAVLGVESCPIGKTDSAETLAARLLPLEHQNYIRVLRGLSKGEKIRGDFPVAFKKMTS